MLHRVWLVVGFGGVAGVGEQALGLSVAPARSSCPEEPWRLAGQGWRLRHRMLHRVRRR